jgi:hypothetical protein
MTRQDITGHINDLLNPSRGYTLKRGFLAPHEADRYRNECDQFLRTTRRI